MQLDLHKKYTLLFLIICLNMHITNQQLHTHTQLSTEICILPCGEAAAIHYGILKDCKYGNNLYQLNSSGEQTKM